MYNASIGNKWVSKKWNTEYPKWTGTNSKLDKLLKHIKYERCIIFYTYKEEMKYISKKIEI